MQFKNRVDAGQKLAVLLERYRGMELIIYALPRGGVIVGAAIAKELNAPLELIITRKIGHPYQQEYAIGAVAENGHSVFDKEKILDVSKEYLESEIEKQTEEAKRRREVYLGKREPVLVQDKIAVLVDDGIATGLTVKAAIKELKLHYKPGKIVVAVPVIPKNISDEFVAENVEVVAIITTKDFLGSIGVYYQDFLPVEDKDIISIMKKFRQRGNI